MSDSSDAVKKCRKHKKEKMIEAMGGCCQLCGFNLPEALVMHHINPKEKKLSFGRVRSDNSNWQTIVEELRKCILLCANCHNTVHSKGLESYNFISSFNEEYSDIQRIPKAHLVSPGSARRCIICNNVLKNTQVNCCSEACRVKYVKNTKCLVDWEVELPNILILRGEGLTYKEIAVLYSVSDNTISGRLKEYIKKIQT